MCPEAEVHIAKDVVSGEASQCILSWRLMVVIRLVIEASGGGIWVPLGNDAALAEAIRVLSQNREQAQAMGCTARLYVVQHFNRHQQALQFAELLQRVAAKTA